MTITGAYTVTASFTTRAEVDVAGETKAAPSGYTCSDYGNGASGAASSGSQFAAPGVQTSGDTNAYVKVTVDAGYSGPGTYTSAMHNAVSGEASIMVGPLSGSGFVDTFRALNQGTTTVTVRPDGSGVVAMSDWFSVGSDSQISGAVSWTCG